MMMTLPIDFANSARSYIALHVAGGDVEVVALDLARLGHRLCSTASIDERYRSRQRMNGWLLMFSSSLVKSRPPRSAS